MTASPNRRTPFYLLLAASLIVNFACTDKGGETSAASGAPTDDDKISYNFV